MGGKRRRLVELGKDVLIVLLTLSALYLTLLGQAAVGSDGVETGWLGGLARLMGRGGTTQTSAGPTGEQPVEVLPMRMALHLAEGGTYGVQYDAGEVERLSDRVFTLLGEALSSAGTPTQVTEARWRQALTQETSVYFDFQGRVPLALLYAWTEAGPGEALAGEQTRRLLLAEDGAGTLTVYYSNEEEGLYYACPTGAGLNGHLLAMMADDDEENGASFAFTHPRGEGYGNLAPYVMLPKNKSATARPVYLVSNPIGRGQNEQNRTALIEALGFHPSANSSYMAGGRQVVREGGDTLSVYDSGVVEYHGELPEEPKYPVGDGGDVPSLLDLVKATQPLVEKSVGALGGDARNVGVYLVGITELEEGRWQVDYGYQLGGVPVRLGREGYAARFLISDGRVSDYTLLLRNYTATEEGEVLLPELQAAAAMASLDAGGKELLLVYEDDGTAETVRAGWIAE